MLPNFTLDPKYPLGEQLMISGLVNFHETIAYIRDLPYGRNQERTNPMLVLTEKKGTCSTKHACLKQIADDHGYPDIELVIGIYLMNEQNTPGIGEILNRTPFSFIPEAHCYLRFKGKRYDYTGIGGNFCQIEAALVKEESIHPGQIGEYKVETHKRFIKKWLAGRDSSCELEEVWAIREACILKLSGY